MKLVALLFVFFSIHIVFSQEQELYQVSPHWKVGDTRKVHTEMSTKVVYDDSLISDLRSDYDIEIKVLAVDEQYLLSYISLDKLGSVLKKSDEIYISLAPEKINSLLENAEIEIGKAELKIKVNNKTGAAIEVRNGLEISRNVKYTSLKELRKWCAKENKTESESRMIAVEFNKRFEEMYPLVEQAILNKTTSIFSAYNIAFPMNSSITREVMTHDLTAASKSDTLFPALMKMETMEVNDKMIVKTSLEYDKFFLLQQLKKSYSKLEKVEPSQVSIIEKEEIIFDLNSTWLVQHSTNMHFQIPGMKTLTKTVVTFL
jgi:hypothetical protein